VSDVGYLCAAVEKQDLVAYLRSRNWEFIRDDLMEERNSKGAYNFMPPVTWGEIVYCRCCNSIKPGFGAECYSGNWYRCLDCRIAGRSYPVFEYVALRGIVGIDLEQYPGQKSHILAQSVCVYCGRTGWKDADGLTYCDTCRAISIGVPAELPFDTIIQDEILIAKKGVKVRCDRCNVE
jgi:hypothetical protein